MLIKKSVSLRLTFWYSLMLFAALLFFSILIFWVVSREIHAEQRGLLMEKIERIKEHMRIDDGELDTEYIYEHRDRFQFEENGVFYEIRNETGTLIRSKNYPRALHVPQTDTDRSLYKKFRTRDGYAFYCLISPSIVHSDRNQSGLYYIITGRSAIYSQRVIKRIKVIGAFMIPLVLLLAGFGGWFMARRAMKPVARLTNTAKDITLGNLDQRLPSTENPDDEIGQLTMTFNEMIARIQNGIEKIRRFTGDASHELRTPLTIMRGEIEVALRKARTADEYKQVLQSSLQELTFMEKIVNDLLTLTRIDAGKTTLQFQHINPDELLQQVIDLHQNAADAKNITIHRADFLDHHLIMADPDKLRRVFSNILDNAIKYSPEGGRVYIFPERKQNVISYIIQDTGIGIPEQDLPHIFERFYRADKSRSRTMHSSGLGLSISNWIVKAHNGSIDISSHKGKGTRVIVSLPVDVQT